MPNKKANNTSFTQSEIDSVWVKGIIDPSQNANIYRKDKCGSWMQKDKYGDRNNKYGWEIDHIKPLAKGGTDDMSNLQPLNWNNNVRKGDTYPWSC